MVYSVLQKLTNIKKTQWNLTKNSIFKWKKLNKNLKTQFLTTFLAKPSRKTAQTKSLYCISIVVNNYQLDIDKALRCGTT